ncbi:MAG: glycolate oxidase [Cellvibrionaceae bacterium]|jgi:glycolate oxidase
MNVSATELADKFRQFIDPETQKVHECDGLSAYCEMPMMVLLPETTEQVQQIMRLCYANGVPVVARGAATSLSAGATPNKEGIALSLAKFKKLSRSIPWRE